MQLLITEVMTRSQPKAAGMFVLKASSLSWLIDESTQLTEKLNRKSKFL